jgi:hypothetical protein
MIKGTLKLLCETEAYACAACHISGFSVSVVIVPSAPIIVTVTTTSSSSSSSSCDGVNLFYVLQIPVIGFLP